MKLGFQPRSLLRVGHGPMARIQIFTKRIEGKWRRDTIRQQISQQLNRGQVPYGFQVAYILAEKPFQPFVLPPPEIPRRLGEEGLWKAAELEQAR